jgi:hypothetical protein
MARATSPSCSTPTFLKEKGLPVPAWLDRAAVIALLVVALGLIWRGRRAIEGFVERLQERASQRGRDIWALLASIGQIVVPTGGVLLLAMALDSPPCRGRRGRCWLTSCRWRVS